MKKAIVGIMVLGICAGLVLAGMDDVTFTATDLTPAYAQTNSFVMRGVLERVELTTDGTTAGTNTVTITSGASTLFNVAFSNNASYFPRIVPTSTTGASFPVGTNIVDKAAVAGTLTVVQLASGAHATNTYTVKIVYQK